MVFESPWGKPGFAGCPTRADPMASQRRSPMKRAAIWILAAVLSAVWIPATKAEASPPATSGVVVVHGTSYGHPPKNRRFHWRPAYRKHRHGHIVYHRYYPKKPRHRHGGWYGYRHRYWVPGHHNRWGIWIPGQWVLLWGPIW